MNHEEETHTPGRGDFQAVKMPSGRAALMERILLLESCRGATGRRTILLVIQGGH